jgi:putative CocE/NonD family hydrolase
MTGWYDWGLNRAFHTWQLIQRHARDAVRTGSMFVIGPSAHNVPGYRDGSDNPELKRTYRGIDNLELLLHWYGHWLRQEPGALEGLSRVSYFLMGANQWDGAEAWPPPDSRPIDYFFHPDGGLSQEPPEESEPDSYLYDPQDPTPTKGGSILSAVVTPGSADVSEVQARSDILVYTTATLSSRLRIVGPIKAVLHATSTAVDTDFVVRLSDVHPDGRALQIQGGILRLRFRNPEAPSLIEPGRLHRLEVDMWDTAHEFAAGHKLRIDVASADFPRFERNSNRGGSGEPPITARQTIYHDPARPSHVVLQVAR